MRRCSEPQDTAKSGWRPGILALLLGCLLATWPLLSAQTSSDPTPTAPPTSEDPAPTGGEPAATAEAGGGSTAAAEADHSPPTSDPNADPAQASPGEPEPMAQRFLNWLEEVDPLITRAERELFQSLRRNYQRDAFVEKFWSVRDPFTRTARNELKERWPLRVAEARSKYGSLTDDRSRILLIHGPPSASFEVRCTTTRSPAEVWGYQGTDRLNFPFALVFVRAGGTGEARVWRPAGAGFALDQALARSRNCLNGGRLGQIISAIRANLESYEKNLSRVLAKPRPRSQEWLFSFVAQSTDMPADGIPLDGQLEFIYPGMHQNRTVVQGLLQIAPEDVAQAEYAGYTSYDFQLTGEVILEDRLFESFRYKFGFPVEEAPETIPLAFQRFLRPGKYRLILKLDDLNSQRVYRRELELEIPRVQETFEIPKYKDPETAALFSEVAAAIEAGDTGIRIIPPRGELHTGFVRFDTLISGDEIRKVQFFLDDRKVLTKNRPPFNVQIDLGPYPDLHTLRAQALGDDGVEVASDTILINSGGYQFRVRLLEPRRGQTYTRSLQARVEVEVPEGRDLDRVELFLNEKPVATLYQEPFVHPVVLPETEEIGYVRAVAYMPDGNSTEDLVFINAPDYLEELEIQFVELYSTALDRAGRPIEGLGRENFQVLEDGVEQDIVRFEQVEDLPIHVGVLIDTSASMVGTLEEVRRAALSFFQQAITPKDRAAVITFNNFPHLAVKLSSDKAALGSGLAGLTPGGKTALYDSVMFSLYYFTGIKGQRAILVLSDGKDESSRFSFEETLEYARRAGITIYAIGLRLFEGGRGKLARLADETGGRSFFINNIEDLENIYGLIQQELRSQYLIAYQSSNTSQDDDFRFVELKVDRPGASVKSISGYYP